MWVLVHFNFIPVKTTSTPQNVQAKTNLQGMFPDSSPLPSSLPPFSLPPSLPPFSLSVLFVLQTALTGFHHPNSEASCGFAVLSNHKAREHKSLKVLCLLQICIAVEQHSTYRHSNRECCWSLSSGWISGRSFDHSECDCVLDLNRALAHSSGRKTKIAIPESSDRFQLHQSGLWVEHMRPPGVFSQPQENIDQTTDARPEPYSAPHKLHPGRCFDQKLWTNNVWSMGIILLNWYRNSYQGENIDFDWSLSVSAYCKSPPPPPSMFVCPFIQMTPMTSPKCPST